MNHYYPAVPPVSNAYYYQRRQPPPAAIPHTPPPQPNPYAPPYIPVAALPPQPLLPLQHSPSHYSRPPTIVSSTPLQPQPQPPPPPPPLPIPSLPPPPPVPAPVVPPPPPAPVSRIPTYPLPGVLPWLSVPNEPFPGRPRRRRRQIAAAKPPRSSEPASSDDAVIAEPNLTTNITGALLDASPDAVTSSSTNAPVLTPTPTTSTSQPMTSKAKPATVPVHTPAVPLPVVPVLPHVPALPLTAAKPTSTPKAKREAPAAVPVVPKEESTTTAPQQATIEPASAAVSEVTTAAAPVTPVVPAAPAAPAAPAVPGAPGAPAASVGPSAPAAPPVPSAPQTRTVSWAELVKSSAPGGNVAKPVLQKANGSLTNGKATLADLLKSFDGTKITAPVIEPRGLVNTGNMCYMNAILQMLMFCGPFYHFLDMLAKKVTHSFKGDTPLIDTMVVFLREFRVLGSHSVYQNLSGHKEKEYLETFGEPFVPEFVYGALREIQRFSSMRRGHQHDAEEFLGFFLDELHEELVRVLKKAGGTTESSPAASDTSEDGWLEVGPKQKAASTRTITILESPITRIFGGQLRSEFKVKGEKSVSVEPYQPLQLDIQSPQVNTIVDALKQLTKPETIHGNFGSTKGAAATTATKQVFIDTLPPVLILHLKRFQYDNQGGTQKIWKKIGYPLQLDIPKEALSPKLRLSSEGTRYKLIGVVYHHGKSASGGHYTVDVLRQDGKNWIRFDDTNIKGVHTDEVKVDVDVKVNPLSGKNGADDEDGWETVNNDVGGAVNGSQAYGKDSKVAYILFYQRN